MAKRAVYVQGPDGFVARDVGPWVDDKVFYVDKLASIFAVGMKNDWPRRAYVELFAGPGLSWDRVKRRFIDGSAIRALQQPFTHYAFVDMDRRATTALRARIAARGRSHQAPVFTADCNAAVADLRTSVPASALTLAFVDPTSWQVRLDTIARLTEGRRVDLLMTFHAPAMRRMAFVEDTRLDAFFGTGRWRELLGRPHWDRTTPLLALYNQQLEQLGYLSSHTQHVPVRNSRGNVIYELVAFSKNERGIDFWTKTISGTNQRGQRSLWD